MNHRQLTGRIISDAREWVSPHVGVFVPGSLPVWRIVPVPSASFPRRGFPLPDVSIPRLPMQPTVRLQGRRAGEAGIALRHRADVWPEVNMGLEVLKEKTQ